MELTHDWIGFQEMFNPRRKAPAGALAASQVNGPMYLVVDADLIVQAFAEQEDLSDWIGGSFETLRASYPHRELIPFERSQVDRWIGASLDLGHFYEQIEFLRDHARPRSAQPVTASGAVAVRDAKAMARAEKQQLSDQRMEIQRHFVLSGIHSWWGKVLPSSYGLFIRVEHDPDPQDFLLLIRRGELIGFHEPDMAYLAHERRRQAPAEIVRYLSEKHCVPVQGVFVSPKDWAEWSQDPHPWMRVAQSVRSKRSKLVPFSWGLTALMTARAVFRF